MPSYSIAALEACALGLAIGGVEAAIGIDWPAASLAHLAAGFALGRRHGGRAWVGGLVFLIVHLGCYVVPLATDGLGHAIGDEVEDALPWLWLAAPTALGLALGVAARGLRASPAPGLPPALRPVVEAVVVGLALGAMELAVGIDGRLFALAHLAAGLALGWRHDGRAWVGWPAVSAGQIGVRVLLIASDPLGHRTGEGLQEMAPWLRLAGPTGVGLVVGVVARRVLAGVGLARRPAGPPIRLLPPTLLGTMGLIAVVGVALAIAPWIRFGANTRYSTGYRETVFRSLRVGMSVAEVRARIAAPLKTTEIIAGGSRGIWVDGHLWTYSEAIRQDRPHAMRSIWVKDGRVHMIFSTEYSPQGPGRPATPGPAPGRVGSAAGGPSA